MRKSGNHAIDRWYIRENEMRKSGKHKIDRWYIRENENEEKWKSCNRQIDGI